MVVKLEKPVHEKGLAADKGQRRDHNEDSIAAVELTLINGDAERAVGVYAVADGVGGEEHGEVASRMAVHTFVNHITQQITEVNESNQPVDDEYEAWLDHAVRAANELVYGTNKEMGTTLVAALLVGHTAYIANVGDSRAYLLTPTRMQQITEDHSFVQELLNSGAIDSEQAATHPYRNVLSQAVGVGEHIEPDMFTIDVEDQSYLLLCSDGLTNEVDKETIYRTIIHADSPQSACDELVQRANQQGGRDNISVLLVKLMSSEQ